MRTSQKCVIALAVGVLYPVGVALVESDIPAYNPGPGVVVVQEDHESFDMPAGERLDIRMNADQEWTGRCDNMGGRSNVEFTVCVGVDY